MKPADYLHLQMELEGIRVHDGNLITRLHPDVEDFPLLLLAQTSDRNVLVYFDDELPPAISIKLMGANLQLSKIEIASEAFATFGIRTKVERFRTYKFPEKLVHSGLEKVKTFQQDHPKVFAFGFAGLADEVYAIEENGEIASACVSSRQNARSAESWVFTRPDQRGKGFAQQVVTAWAAGMQRKDLIPFYSHAEDNHASATVARKLNLDHLYTEIVIEAAQE